MKQIKFLIFICIFLSLRSFAAEGEYDIRNIGFQDGLKNEFIFDMAQDSRGYIWLATDAGIYRYDGRRFFLINTRNSSLRSNIINCLFYEKDKDRLWVGTALGLYLLECPTIKLTPASPELIPEHIRTYNIVSIKRGSGHSIWLVNRHTDIVKYDLSNGKVTVLNEKSSKGIGDTFTDVEEDERGNLLIATSGSGLTKVNLETKVVRQYKSEKDNAHSLSGDYIVSLFRDHSKHIWIATKTGLSIYEPVSETFHSFRHTGAKGSLNGNSVQTIREMADGSIWVGCDDGGISIAAPTKTGNIYNGKPDFISFTDNFYTANIKPVSTKVSNLFQDDYANVWIGYSGGGLDFLGHDKKMFESVNILGYDSNMLDIKHVSSIYPDHDGSLWLGAAGKLLQYKNNKITASYDIESREDIVAIYPIGTSLLLGLENEGIFIFDKIKRTSKRIGLPSENLSVYSALTLQDGRNLVGTNNGVFILTNGVLDRLNNIPHPVAGLPSSSMIKDKDSRIWIGTYGDGVYVFDTNLHLIQHLSSTDNCIASNAVRHLFLDSRGWIWIGGQDGLTCVRDTRSISLIYKYTYREGLEDVNIRAINEDLFGNIWVSTNSGLSRWDKKTSRIENYDYRQGIPNSAFIDRATAVGQNDTLYFAALKGLCHFNPKDIDYEMQITPVNITEIQMPSNLKDDGQFIPIPMKDRKIELPYDKNTFSVRFVMPDHFLSGNVESAYQMGGIDDSSWTPINDDNMVSFNNLKPGKYKFCIKSRFRNQNWEDGFISSAEIVITPPIWLTWWAKTFYMLVAIILACVVFRYYHNRMKRQNAIEIEHREAIKERELNHERLRFFTNITHELRTPLTLIISPLEDLVADKSLDSTHRHRLDLIHKSSLRLLNLVNQLLEFRKTETQNRTLKIEYGHLNKLITEIGLRFRELNRNKNVNIEVEVSPEIGKFYFDPEVIRIIINNFLGNALKYTRSGKVTLSLKPQLIDGHKWAEISVSDTGVGIPPEAMPHIFERYYQAKRNYQASGTGIGLALVKSLSDLHGGKISVDSIEGQGSVFRFSINTEETYPDAVHSESKEEKPTIEQMDATVEEQDQRPRLLIVEDDDDIRQYVEETFCDDYRVIAASDGASALGKARELIPDLIISDIMMPVMDGIELCKAVKSDMATSHIPVVLLTAKDSLRDKEEGYECGADSYLTKPFTAKLLKNRIENILEARRKLADYFMDKTIKAHAEVIDTVADDTEAKTTDERIQDECPAIIINKLDEEFMNKFNELIEEHISDESLDMELIQDKMNMSYSTFYRKIKALTGMSGNEYIRKVRLNRVKTLLASSTSVSEVAWKCGFNDMVYFRKCFKKEFGITPSAFIKSKTQKS